MSSLHILVGAMVGVFLISMIADEMLARHFVAFDAATRDRIWKREARLQIWWRIPQYIGVTLMVVGVLRNLGVLKIPGLGVTQSIAGGLAVYCMASIARSWFSKHAVGVEAPGTPASRGALVAALLITVAELSLAGVVGWMVFKDDIRAWISGPKKPVPAISTSEDDGKGAAPGVTPEKSPAQKLIWVDEAEALRMLKGKNAAYLKALARRGDVRSEKVEGQVMYRRDDISAMKIAGLPTEEELAAESKAEPSKGEKIEP